MNVDVAWLGQKIGELVVELSALRASNQAKDLEIEALGKKLAYRETSNGDEELKSYRLLIDCYRSGQMSEEQWQAHLENKSFAAWVKTNA